MSLQLVFKPTALKDLRKLPRAVQKRIGLKLQFYIKQSDPMVYAVPLIGSPKAGHYRYRIGEYRAVFDKKDETIIILYIEHRRDVYRKK